MSLLLLERSLCHNRLCIKEAIHVLILFRSPACVILHLNDHRRRPTGQISRLGVYGLRSRFWRLSDLVVVPIVQQTQFFEDGKSRMYHILERLLRSIGKRTSLMINLIGLGNGVRVFSTAMLSWSAVSPLARLCLLSNLIMASSLIQFSSIMALLCSLRCSSTLNAQTLWKTLSLNGRWQTAESMKFGILVLGFLNVTVCFALQIVKSVFASSASNIEFQRQIPPNKYWSHVTYLLFQEGTAPNGHNRGLE